MDTIYNLFSQLSSLDNYIVIKTKSNFVTFLWNLVDLTPGYFQNTSGFISFFEFNCPFYPLSFILGIIQSSEK